MLMFRAVASLLSTLVLADAYDSQTILGSQKHDASLFTPIGTLSALSESTFTTLEHPFFPKYSVRLKKTRFCDETVNAYTGYIDIQAKHLFFYFFESRNEPAKDDVILWTNGGPGCSSSMGLFMELGPCRIPNENGTVFHPESWNSNANIFFIDQPVGVGFSYAEHGESVSTSEEAAKDVAAFVAIFFENFSQFKGRGFHMSGESIGGRYLPVFASAIYDQNAKLVEAGLTPINLTSMMIGNGLTDIFKMILSYYDMQCTPASIEPFVDIATCVTLKLALKRCEKWMQSSCVDIYDPINCPAAVNFCNDFYSAPFNATGKNPYDVTKQCIGEPHELCYSQTKYIVDYLSKPDIRSLIGVDPSITQNFTFCSYEISNAFEVSQDLLQQTWHYVSALLERKVRVLIYAGSNDWACNWVGNERWTLDLEWSGKNAFGAQKLRDWKVEGKRAGKTRGANGFTFATIDGAGHMVPFDKPKESLELVQRWIAGREL